MSFFELYRMNVRTRTRTLTLTEVAYMCLSLFSFCMLFYIQLGSFMDDYYSQVCRSPEPEPEP